MAESTSEVRRFIFQNVEKSEKATYRPIFQLIAIAGESPVSPQIGDILGRNEIEAIVYNGNEVLLRPSEEFTK